MGILEQNKHEQLDNDNKIVVNSRLKQFLFDWVTIFLII